VLVKLDFSNAFNSFDRICMLRLVREHFPSLYGYALAAYGAHSHLFHGPARSSRRRRCRGDVFASRR
jgi:hypothetical protein